MGGFTPRPDASAIAGFLKLLFGDKAPGLFAIWTKGDKLTKWFPATEITAAAQYMAACAVMDDCYFGVGLQKKDLGARSRGTANTVIGIAGVWLDLDVAGRAHAQKKLPSSTEDALSFLQELPHPPTIVISSGHGLQVWWLFEDPWIFANDEDRQAAQKLVTEWQKEINRAAADKG